MITALAVILAAAVAAVARAVRPHGRHRGARPAPAGVVATGYRYCPAELRQRAAVLHPDGSATCADCTAHIPEAGA